MKFRGISRPIALAALAGGLGGAVLAACGSAQVSLKADAKASGKTDDGKQHDFDKPLDGPQFFPEPEEELRKVALIGARQDLSFNGPATNYCSCLALAVGQGEDRAFAWEGEPPRTDPGKQLVFAMTEEPCSDAKSNTLGVSYRGFRIEERNVIVMLEAARAGLPKTSGAIIPKPPDEGDVFIEPTGTIPYGKAAEGEGLCSIGNPGGPRIGAMPGPRGEVKEIFGLDEKRKRLKDFADPKVPAVAAEPEEPEESKKKPAKPKQKPPAAPPADPPPPVDPPALK